MAQISEYTDCSAIQSEAHVASAPLTADEKVALLDDEYYVKVADVTKCQEPSATSGSGSSGGSGGGGGAGANGSGAKSVSNNELLPGDRSIAITDSMYQEAASIEGMNGAPPGPAAGSSGRQHQQLESVDNRAAIRAQIKAQADAETDPEIKELLMEQYEALK